MANPVYRKKNCPQCDTEHRKKGPFCCQGCHNTFRGQTEATRLKQSISAKTSIDARAATQLLKTNSILHKLGEEALTTDDYYLEIPDIDSLDDEEKINW